MSVVIQFIQDRKDRSSTEDQLNVRTDVYKVDIMECSCLSVCLSRRLSVCQSVCLSPFLSLPPPPPFYQLPDQSVFHELD